jgi:hypothetical protein
MWHYEQLSKQEDDQESPLMDLYYKINNVIIAYLKMHVT